MSAKTPGATQNPLNNNEESFGKALAFIKEGQSFLLATHPRTDGDDCGSMLALTAVLHNMGKKAQPVAALGGVPLYLRFLPGQNQVLDEAPHPAELPFYDHVILFGCRDRARTGIETILTTKLPILNIDHHGDNTLFGDENLVDQSKSSVAELVFDFFKWAQIEITPEMAKCLLTGIFTDTGSFMHANTSSSALAAAGELMREGARVDKIHEFTYKSKSSAGMKAWAKAFENARIDKQNKVAISIITEEDLKEIGPISSDAFQGVVETLNTIPDARFAMFLRQEGNIIKGSMRSEEGKRIDVSRIAKIFGGGGHKLAAGFEVPGRLVRLPTGGWKIEEV